MSYLVVSFVYLLFLGLITYFIVKAVIQKTNKIKGVQELLTTKNWYLQPILSKEDFVSQAFFLLSILFLGLALLFLNKSLNEPVNWRFIIFFASLIGIIVSYYFKAIYTLSASLLGIIAWWISQGQALIFEKNIKDIFLWSGLLLIFLIFYLLGRIHEKETKFKRASIIYLILGFISITIILFLFSTNYGLNLLEEITKGEIFLKFWQPALVLFILFILFVGLLIYALTKNFIFKLEGISIVFLITLFSLLLFVPEQNIFLTDDNYSGKPPLSSTGIFWAILFNLLIVLELIGIISLGYIKREEWLIDIGTVFIFFLIVVKYFDWFFDFLDKSIFFIGAGILLVITGWLLEKGRRYLIFNTQKQWNSSQ